MNQYIIDGQLVSSTDPLFSQALLQAYNKKVRPLCSCKTPGVEMYLARTSTEQVIIKRMPNTGHSHNPDCDSYEPPAELSGRGELQSKAISEDQTTGKTALKLDFSLSKSSITRTMGKGTGEPAAVVKADPKKLSLKSLLHYLYDEAGLNRWTPAMAGKRNWFVVQKHLHLAASKSTAKKQSLADRLLIPEPFRPDDKAGITARRRQFLSKFTKKGSSQPVGILVGELKLIDQARFGHKMVIKHLPDAPLYYGDDVEKRLNKSFARELDLHAEDETVHTLVAATFTLSASGNMQLDAVTMMSTDSNWIPFDDFDERSMIETLTTNHRRYIKGLRYNLSPGDIIASALLTDTGDSPTALYIDPHNDEQNPEFAESLDRVIKDSEYSSLVWRPLCGEVLTLPPASRPTTGA